MIQELECILHILSFFFFNKANRYRVEPDSPAMYYLRLPKSTVERRWI